MKAEGHQPIGVAILATIVASAFRGVRKSYSQSRPVPNVVAARCFYKTCRCFVQSEAGCTPQPAIQLSCRNSAAAT
eukprot:7055397-Pyramimonas_sp.AAC.1